MPTDKINPDLWCVHVQGPDSMIAQPNQGAAEARATQWNNELATFVPDRPSKHSPTIKCTAKPWHYSPTAHADDLAKHGGNPDDIC